MRLPPIIVQQSNTASTMAASNGVDAISNSSADLSSRLSIDTSKVKDKEEPSQNSNNTTNGDNGNNSLPQDSLSLMQLRRVVGDVSRMRVGFTLLFPFR